MGCSPLWWPGPSSPERSLFPSRPHPHLPISIGRPTFGQLSVQSPIGQLEDSVVEVEKEIAQKEAWLFGASKAENGVLDIWSSQRLLNRGFSGDSTMLSVSLLKLRFETSIKAILSPSISWREPPSFLYDPSSSFPCRHKRIFEFYSRPQSSSIKGSQWSNLKFLMRCQIYLLMD